MPKEKNHWRRKESSALRSRKCFCRSMAAPIAPFRNDKARRLICSSLDSFRRSWRGERKKRNRISTTVLPSYYQQKLTYWRGRYRASTLCLVAVESIRYRRTLTDPIWAGNRSIAAQKNNARLHAEIRAQNSQTTHQSQPNVGLHHLIFLVDTD